MSNSRQTGKPSQSPHDGGSNPNLLVHTTDINLDDTQAVPPLEADTPELSQHIGSSTLLPQPLQLLCDNNRRRSTRAKHVLAGKGRIQQFCVKLHDILPCRATRVGHVGMLP